MENKELKPSEMSIKQFAKHIGKSVQHVNLMKREGYVKWRYLFPETKEHVLIDSAYKFVWEKSEIEGVKRKEGKLVLISEIANNDTTICTKIDNESRFVG